MSSESSAATKCISNATVEAAQDVRVLGRMTFIPSFRVFISQANSQFLDVADEGFKGLYKTNITVKNA